MSETPFFKTRMGHRFYEHTIPELVKQLEQLNQILGQIASRLDQTESSAQNDLAGDH